MNIAEELTEETDAEEVKPEVIKRGRGRPKIPEELRKTKPKIISGLARGRPKIHPTTFQKIPSGMKRGRPRKNRDDSVKKQKNLRQLKIADEKPKVLEIDIGDKAQLSVIKDFTNDDLLDILPVKFVTKSSRVKGRPVKTTISQEIRLMVIKPNNGKYRGRPRKYSNSDDEDYNDTPSSSKGQGQASASKGRGRPRKYPKVDLINDFETNNSPSTSRGRKRPIKTPKVNSSDYSTENNLLSTPKGPGRPRKHLQESVPSTSRGISRTPHISYAEYNDSDYSDGEDDENYNNSTSYSQGQGSISKGRGRPRKYPKIEIDDDCTMTSLPSTSKGRGRPRIHPKVEIDNDLDDINSSSGSRGRPRKDSKKTTSLTSITSKGRGRPRKHPLIDQSVLDSDSGINESCLPSTSKGPGRPRKYPKVEKPLEDKPKKGRGRPRKFHVPKPVVDNDAQISIKPKLGRGRPRKESRMITETPSEEENDVDIKSEINGNEEYSEEGREEENVLPTDESETSEDIEYCISLNSEQTDDIKPDIPVIDVNDEPVCTIIS